MLDAFAQPSEAWHACFLAAAASFVLAVCVLPFVKQSPTAMDIGARSNRHGDDEQQDSTIQKGLFDDDRTAELQIGQSNKKHQPPVGARLCDRLLFGKMVTSQARRRSAIIFDTSKDEVS